jgi:SAM-dependent methyltransferase
MSPNESEVQTSYDLVADEYAKRLYHELEGKAFDRKMLDWLAERVNGKGLICDLGCGPGHVARYLQTRGANVCGIDLSAEMVKQAQRLNPDIVFTQGNMLALHNIVDSSFVGVAAFYSIIHVPRASVVVALQEIKRILQPGGILLLTFHLGEKLMHIDEWWEREVSLDFHFFSIEEIKSFLSTAGFAIEEVLQRESYPEVEVQTNRAYIFARKP